MGVSSGRGLTPLVLILAVGSTARAQTSTSTVGAHPAVEAELFGAPAEGDDEPPGPEAELFGADTSSTGEARERELFGGPEAPAAVGRAAPSELLGGLRDSLEAASDRLALGGTLFLRLEYRASSEGAAASFPLVSPSTLDLYLDARPIDRVRTYARARLAYDFTLVGDGQTPATDLTDPTDAPDGSALLQGGGRESTQVFLDQLWVKFDADRIVFFTVGKQRVRWGTGRIWNPTDFLNAQRFDPLSLFDRRLGVGLVKAHIPFEDLGANVYAVANLDGADQLDRVGAALRAEIAFSTTEVAISGSWRKDEPLRFGADVSTGLGPFELRAEAALLHDVAAPFFSGAWSAADPLFSLTEVDVTYRDDELIPQIVLGGDVTLDYGDGDQLIAGLEYFYNDAGYPDASLYPLLLVVPGLARSRTPLPALRQNDDVPAPVVGQVVGSALGLRGAPPALFQPLYLGRHYLAAFALFPAPLGLEDHTFTLTGIANLSDRSGVARLDHALRLFRFLSLRSYLNVHAGERGEFRLGVDVGEIPGVLPSLSIPPPLFELGVALNATL